VSFFAADNLGMNFGGIRAVDGVSFAVERGQVFTIIGPNGAGKTTIFNLVSRIYDASGGRLLFRDEDITRVPPHEIARRGIARTFQVVRAFPRMTVLENLQMGASVADVAHFEEDLARVFQLFPRLRERLHQRGGTLSGGEQQMLAIGRALMSRPRLLLLDEPSLGLAPLLVHQIFSAIRELNGRDNLTVFLVEQNAFHALKLAHRGYVMINGQITLSGIGRELLKRPEIRAAYLEGSRIDQAQGKT